MTILFPGKKSRNICELAVALNLRSDMIGTLMSTILQRQAVRDYRMQIQMNSLTKRTNFSGSRWQRIALALLACVRSSLIHSFKPDSFQYFAEVIFVLVAPVKALAANLCKQTLCKHLTVAVVRSVMAIRVRHMIT